MPDWPPPPPTPSHALHRRPVRRRSNGDEYRVRGVIHYLWVAGIVAAAGLIAMRGLG